MGYNAAMRGEECNRVIIHVWTSKHNKSRAGQDVGHVSIAIPSLQLPTDPGSGYYSFWPHLVERNHIGYVMPVPGFYMKGYRRPAGVAAVPEGQMYEYDCDAENRDAEISICLYSLNIHKMKQVFEQKKTEVDRWVLIGKNILRRKNNDANSCASLARDLLVAGGIEELLSSSSFCSASIPDQFVPLLQAAKETENKRYPNTKKFTHPDESTLPKGKNWTAGTNFLLKSCSIQ